jgi:hypothetical protein
MLLLVLAVWTPVITIDLQGLSEVEGLPPINTGSVPDGNGGFQTEIGEHRCQKVTHLVTSRRQNVSPATPGL